MFNLSESEKARFVKLEQIYKDVTEHKKTGEEFNLAINGLQLESHLKAHSFASKVLGGEVNIKDDKHQRILGLALIVQQNPQTWRQYDLVEQQTIWNLVAARDASERAQREGFLACVVDNIFDLRNVADGSTVAAVVAPNPYTIGMATAINILVGRFAGGKEPKGGASLEMVECLDKLDSGDFLVTGVKLQTDALQYVTKKHQSSIDQIKQVLGAYGIRLEDMNKAQRDEVRKLYVRFLKKERESALRSRGDVKEVKQALERMREESLAERERQKEREQYFKRLEDAKVFFKGLQNLASLIEDPKLSKNLRIAGCIGEQGISIASNVMQIQGLIAGAAPISAMSMLLPMANIAIAAASIIFMFLGKKKKKESSSEPSPFLMIMEALQTISKQIAQLRKEMHERFDLIDEKLHRIALDMFEGFERIRSILAFETGILRDMIDISVGRVQEDLDELTRITESGHRDLALMHYRDTVEAPVMSYIDDASITTLDTTKLLILERNWLLGQFCSGLFAGRYYRRDQPYHQVERISEKPAELILGYLARFAKERLDIQGIQDVELPSVDLWLNGIDLALAGGLH